MTQQSEMFMGNMKKARNRAFKLNTPVSAVKQKVRLNLRM